MRVLTFGGFLLALCFLCQCAERRPQAANLTARTFDGGSIGTSGGGDVEALIPEYQLRVVEFAARVQTSCGVEQSGLVTAQGRARYTSFRSQLQRAAETLADPERSQWEMQIWQTEPLLVRQPAIRTGSRLLLLESRRLWSGILDDQESRSYLTELVLRTAGITLPVADPILFLLTECIAGGLPAEL